MKTFRIRISREIIAFIDVKAKDPELAIQKVKVKIQPDVDAAGRLIRKRMDMIHLDSDWCIAGPPEIIG